MKVRTVSQAASTSFSAGQAARATTRAYPDRHPGAFGFGCPYHMGNRVHPAESLAACFPWLAREWHPTRNELHPDQVSRASGREVIWRCEEGHEWAAVVYARTLSRSGCPTCYQLETSERIKAGMKRARQVRDEQAGVKISALLLDPD